MEDEIAYPAFQRGKILLRIGRGLVVVIGRHDNEMGGCTLRVKSIEPGDDPAELCACEEIAPWHFRDVPQPDEPTKARAALALAVYSK